MAPAQAGSRNLLAFGPIFRPNPDMRTCRLYMPSSLDTGQKINLTDEQNHYLDHVMRLQSGDPVILFNGEGGEYNAVIYRPVKSKAVCHIEKYIPIDREMPCKAHIIQAACRNEKIEILLQKGTELGASSFQIVRTARSTLKLADNKLEARLKRWRTIIIEAVEQSGRTRLPSLCWHRSLADIRLSGLSYALHPLAARTWGQARKQIARSNAVDFVIGPEGGLNPHDLNTLTEMGCNMLTFGPRIMRTETAAPALLAATQAIQREI